MLYESEELSSIVSAAVERVLVASNLMGRIEALEQLKRPRKSNLQQGAQQLSSYKKVPFFRVKEVLQNYEDCRETIERDAKNVCPILYNELT